MEGPVADAKVKADRMMTIYLATPDSAKGFRTEEVLGSEYRIRIRVEVERWPAGAEAFDDCIFRVQNVINAFRIQFGRFDAGEDTSSQDDLGF